MNRSNECTLFFYHKQESEAVVQRCSVKKGLLENFTKFAGIHLCQSLLLIKPQSCNFSKNETLV